MASTEPTHKPLPLREEGGWRSGTRETCEPGAPGEAPDGEGLKVMMLDPPAAVAAVSHNLCNALGALGCDVDLFTAPFWRRFLERCRTRRYRPRVDFYRSTQIPAHTADGRWMKLLWRIAQLFSHIKVLARLAPATRNYDVVHVQWTPVPPLDVVWVWLISRWATVAYTVHNLLPHDTKYERWNRFWYGIAYRSADVLFVHAEKTARGLREEFGIPDSKISRIRHGSMEHLLDLEPKQPSPPLNAEGDSIVLFLGQIRPYKGVDVLLRAAALLPESLPFRVVVAGKPSIDVPAHRALAKELGVDDRVDFRFGFIEEDVLPTYFRAATIMAFPYKEVDQSGVAISGCTFGRPIVASRVGGLAEIVEEAENGLVVPPDDPEALAAALERLLVDEELRSTCASNSRRYAVTALSWSRIARTTVSAYRAAKGASAAPVRGGREKGLLQ